MTGLVLDKRADVWRKVLNASTGQAPDTLIRSNLACAIIPISSFDLTIAYARESTHLIFVPFWYTLRKEDQLRYGGQPLDEFSDIRPYIYVINGHPQYRLGMNQSLYYAREQE